MCFILILFWSGCVHTKLSLLDNGKITGLMSTRVCYTIFWFNLYSTILNIIMFGLEFLSHGHGLIKYIKLAWLIIFYPFTHENSQFYHNILIHSTYIIKKYSNYYLLKYVYGRQEKLFPEFRFTSFEFFQVNFTVNYIIIYTDLYLHIF